MLWVKITIFLSGALLCKSLIAYKSHYRTEEVVYLPSAFYPRKPGRRLNGPDGITGIKIEIGISALKALPSSRASWVPLTVYLFYLTSIDWLNDRNVQHGEQNDNRMLLCQSGQRFIVDTGKPLLLQAA